MTALPPEEAENAALPRILCVDDEPKVLAALRRHLCRRYDIATAEGGQEGLETIQTEGPFAVVVSDMRMPGLDGAEFLRRVRETHPDTVRILLTGYAEVDSAVAAVNDGNIFRFLCKPCPKETLQQALDEAVEHYRLVRAERELLEQTLKGSIDMLVDLLSLTAPAVFERSKSMQSYVSYMAERLGLADRWQFEVAALLGFVGCVTVPPEVLERAFAGESLAGDEQAMMDAHPETAHRLLQRIPRLDTVREIVRHQKQSLEPDLLLREGAEVVGHFGDDTVGLGAFLFQAADAVAGRAHDGVTVRQAVDELVDSHPDRCRFYETLIGFPESKREYRPATLPVTEMITTMVLDQDVRTHNGTLVLTRGRELDETLLERLRNFSQSGAIDEPLRVLRRVA